MGRFQSICLERPTLINVRFADVPLPMNCNDNDLGVDFAWPRPLNEPTTMSMNIFRATIFRLINEALVSNPTHLKSFELVVDLDRQLLEVMDKLPWYFQLEADGKAKTFPSGYDFLTWQNHILRTCVSTQRVRMYRPFLADHKGTAFHSCSTAVADALAVYRSMRADKNMHSQQKFYPQAYQIFSVAVTMAALLLVERTLANSVNSRIEIQRMASDLGLLETQGCPVPVAINGRKVLLKMLSLIEQGESCSPEDAERLVPDISIILGGENSTRAYLSRRTTRDANGQTVSERPVTEPQQAKSSEQANYTGDISTLAMSSRNREEDLSFMLRAESSSLQFDFDDFQLSDSHDLFGWDMTGLLSDALAVQMN